MDLLKAIQERHSVRSYRDDPIAGDAKESLLNVINEVSSESGLSITLVLDEEEAFSGILAHYGKFSGVRNYIAIATDDDRDYSEEVGYFGERIVLAATALGLDTCWVALTLRKSKVKPMIEKGKKLSIVIAVGYGETHGSPHKSKSREDVMMASNPPDWFIHGIDAALLAPTAMNQQKFRFILSGDKVLAKSGRGFYSKIDLGIAKCHFEIGSGKSRSIFL